MGEDKSTIFTSALNDDNITVNQRGKEVEKNNIVKKTIVKNCLSKKVNNSILRDFEVVHNFLSDE